MENAWRLCLREYITVVDKRLLFVHVATRTTLYRQVYETNKRVQHMIIVGFCLFILIFK